MERVNDVSGSSKNGKVIRLATKSSAEAKRCFTGVQLLRHMIFRVVGTRIELLQLFLLLLLFLFTFRQFSLEVGVCVV